MITITRSLARKLRAVFRRAGFKPRGGLAPPVAFHAGPDGLRIRSMTADVAVEYHLPGEFSAEELTVPLELFDDCQGKRDESVSLESGKKKNSTIASWRDSGIPQLVAYDATPVKKLFPEVPATLLPVDAEFWPALRDAAECTDQSPSRYALHNVQFRGEMGQVCAADGRQVYWHDGFQFSWTGDVLVPASGVLGCAELVGEGSVEIGKTESSLVLRIGNWTLVLTIDSVGRFPALDEIATRAAAGTSLLRLSLGDAEFLTTALPKLPREDSEFHGVTLDLNGRAILQAQAAADRPRTDVLLSNTTIEGPPIRIAMDRRYLLRAVTRGFRVLRLSDPNQPLLAVDERRQYIWAPLSLNEALGQAAEVIRIESPPEGGGDSRNPSQLTRSGSTMSEATTNSQAVGEGAVAIAAEPITNAESATDVAGGVNTAIEVAPHAQRDGQGRRTRTRKAARPASAGAIEQAIVLRDSLRESVAKSNELIRSLKRQRQQSRLVATTLASLKQLQQAG